MADPNKDLFDWLENSVGGYILRRQRFGRIEQAPPSMEAFFEYLRARRCYELKNNPPTVFKDRLVKLREDEEKLERQR